MTSDLETLKAMFDRARIPYTASDPEGSDTRALRTGAEMIVTIGDHLTPEQPHPGGYSGFFTEFLFDHDGALLAAWVWE